ncbi:hypothetical protein M758_11G115300 [Ceratodon purpureus]|nr:hypothetical protein M758_11G115300 [Ceratodon purpureus]
MANAGAVDRRRARARRLFERRGMRSQRIPLDNGTTLHCWVPPSGCEARPPLMLVHGFGWDGMTTWELQLEAFLEAEFAVYVPDLIFFGDSTTTSSRRDVAFQAECLVAMLRRLGVQSGVHVLGTSYGGMTSFLMASMFPEMIHKVVIASSGVCMDKSDYEAFGKKYNMLGMRNAILPTTVDEVKESLSFIVPNPPQLANSTYEELLEVMYLKNRESKMELYKGSSFGTDEALTRPTLTQEVLLIWGEHDRLFDIHQALKLKKHLGNGVELVIIKDVGHTPHSEAPKAFNTAAIGFFKSGSLPQSRL